MKTIPLWRRMHPETTLTILLIVVALIAAIIRCGDGAVVRFDLAISSTAGGNVTVPGEGNFAYDAGAVVSLIASADTDWRFVEWSGDVGTIADVEAASTVIVMNGNYFITANFGIEPE